jgi:hypothetical protein
MHTSPASNAYVARVTYTRRPHHMLTSHGHLPRKNRWRSVLNRMVTARMLELPQNLRLLLYRSAGASGVPLYGRFATLDRTEFPHVSGLGWEERCTRAVQGSTKIEKHIHVRC